MTSHDSRHAERSGRSRTSALTMNLCVSTMNRCPPFLLRAGRPGGGTFRPSSEADLQRGSLPDAFGSRGVDHDAWLISGRVALAAGPATTVRESARGGGSALTLPHD